MLHVNLPYLSPQDYERLENELGASFMGVAGAHRTLTKLLCFRDSFSMSRLGYDLCYTGVDEKSMLLWWIGVALG